jgi:hypothetical protein
MQVYPKYWLKKQFTDSLGKDLASDSTSVRFSVFILSQSPIPHTSGERVTRPDGVARYNGCVRGANTPHCKNYPDR